MPLGGEIIYRTGEIRKNNKGTDMRIMLYRSYNEIDVEFLDKFHYVTTTTYSNFKRGQVRNPYDITVNGVGYIGDGEYKTKKSPQRHTDAYNTWVTLLYRCYCDETTVYYKESEVCQDWLCYQNFAKWYETNQYKVKGRLHLDKDILFPGNKMYAPDKCLLVPQRINMLFVNQSNNRNLPNGIRKASKGFLAKYNNKELGIYNTVEEAYNAYSQKKKEEIVKIANEYKGVIPQKVYDALLKYEFDIHNDRNYLIQ